VYIDEAGMDNREDYSYGWNEKGKRFYALKSGRRQGRVNMIAALCNGQLLAPFTVVGSCNRIAPGQKITMDAAESLRWAQSPQGQLARNIMNWNSESLANLNCTKLAAQQSLVAKEKGKEAVSQYCLLRVKPVK
jgi:hypothetical protein